MLTKKVVRKQFSLYLEINDKKKVKVCVNIRIKDELLRFQKNHKFIATNEHNTEITISKQFFSNKHNVQNSYRYQIIKEVGIYELYEFENPSDFFKRSRFNEYADDIENSIPSVLLVLESPHKDEYLYSNDSLSPVAPAQGSTGEEIADKIIDVMNSPKIKKHLGEEKYRIIIANPIPVQTSLHFLHKQSLSSVYKTLRDKVWEALWVNGDYCKSFIELISNDSVKLVLNCCTTNVSPFISQLLCVADYNFSFGRKR